MPGRQRCQRRGPRRQRCRRKGRALGPCRHPHKRASAPPGTGSRPGGMAPGLLVPQPEVRLPMSCCLCDAPVRIYRLHLTLEIGFGGGRQQPERLLTFRRPAPVAPAWHTFPELSIPLSPLYNPVSLTAAGPRHLMSAVAAFRVSLLAKHFVQSSATASTCARLTAGRWGCRIGSGGRPIAGVTRSIILPHCSGRRRPANCLFIDCPSSRTDWLPRAVRTMATGSAAAAARSVGRLAPSETALLVCDVQERFRPVITGFPAVIDTSKRMVRRARCV